MYMLNEDCVYYLMNFLPSKIKRIICKKTYLFLEQCLGKGLELMWDNIYLTFGEGGRMVGTHNYNKNELGYNVSTGNNSIIFGPYKDGEPFDSHYIEYTHRLISAEKSSKMINILIDHSSKYKIDIMKIKRQFFK